MPIGFILLKKGLIWSMKLAVEEEEDTNKEKNKIFLPSGTIHIKPCTLFYYRVPSRKQEMYLFHLLYKHVSELLSVTLPLKKGRFCIILIQWR